MNDVINLAERRERLRLQRKLQETTRHLSGYISYERGFPRSEYIRALENEIAYIREGMLEGIESCDDVTGVSELAKMLSGEFDEGEAGPMTRAEFDDWLQTCTALPANAFLPLESGETALTE